MYQLLKALGAALISSTFVLFWLPAAIAGGLTVIPDSVTINKGSTEALQPNQEIEISFFAYNYHFGSSEYMYLPIVIVPLGDRERSASISEIRKWQIFVLELAGGAQTAPVEEKELRLSVRLRVPGQFGRYKIMYSYNPLFYGRPLQGSGGRRTIFRPVGPDQREAEFAVSRNRMHLTSMGEFSVAAPRAREAADNMPLYLKVNNEIPGLRQLKGGISETPLTFSWELRGPYARQKQAVTYRYKLWPSDKSFGEWSSEIESIYTFLNSGAYEFQVQAKFDDGKQSTVSHIANFSFFMPETMIVQPTEEVLIKAMTGAQVSPNKPSIDVDSVYSGSRALLVGVWNFDDRTNLPAFEERKIRNDIETLKVSLERNGFSVTTLIKQRVNKDEVLGHIDDLVKETKPNERVLVYFSTHGFPDPLSPSDVYLATSDCTVAKPRVKCLKLSDLETDAKRVLALDARQVLFAIDSCFAGLGVVSKSLPRTNLTRLAAHQGAFMLTAGLPDQKAQIDQTLNMSTFTHFLAKGLDGSADLIEDGVITMTELFLYVQYETARQTKSEQIPMMGRLLGQGEMLFKKSAANLRP